MLFPDFYTYLHIKKRLIHQRLMELLNQNQNR